MNEKQQRRLMELNRPYTIISWSGNKKIISARAELGRLQRRMTMRKLLTAMAAMSTLAVSLPAMAQSFSDRSDRIEERIEAGRSDGSLTWREARDLRSRLRDVQRTQDAYERNGMSAWEARDLDRRFDQLSNDVYGQRHDTQYRYERRGYDPY
jgi:hypothetical protein